MFHKAKMFAIALGLSVLFSAAAHAGSTQTTETYQGAGVSSIDAFDHAFDQFESDSDGIVALLEWLHNTPVTVTYVSVDAHIVAAGTPIWVVEWTVEATYSW